MCLSRPYLSRSLTLAQHLTLISWFSRAVIEGLPLSSAGAFGDASASPDDEDDLSGDSDDSDSDSFDRGGEKSEKQGFTYYVGGGKVKLMENGMAQYVQLVERRLAKRKRIAEAEARKKG